MKKHQFGFFDTLRTFTERRTGRYFVRGLLLLVVAAIFMVPQVHATEAQKLAGKTLLTVYDQRVATTISTNKSTVGDALAEAGILLDDSDNVEPSRDEELTASRYTVNIYRARPVLAVDGNVRRVIITASQSTEDIARDAGISLFEDDIAKLSLVRDVLTTGAAERFDVSRATPIELTLFGDSFVIRTQAKTVGEFLDEKDIKIDGTTRASLPSETLITENLKLKIWREGRQTVTRDEAINFEVEQIQDRNRKVGYRQIKTAGIKGLRSVTYETVVIDGNEVRRKEISSVVRSKPQSQVEVVGTKYTGVYTTPGQNEKIVWNYLLAQGFSREQTAGIMGNLQQEHGFKTSGDGLAQWTGGRKSLLMSWDDPYSVYTQLDFMMYELNGGYSSVKANIKASKTIEDATRIFQNEFERCGLCREDLRIQFAYNIYKSHR